MEELISVIVPIYNAEKYLANCIESILAQSYKQFELLLINDGSKDASEDICKKYAQKDNRIRIISKENSGVADTRNLGIDKAIGKYVTFIDADDYVEERAFEKAVNKITQENASICGYHFNYVKGDSVSARIESRFKTTILNGATRRELVNNLYSMNENGIMPAVWRYLFEREFLLKNGIKFPNNKIGEDLIFVLEAFRVADKLVVLDDALYNYRVNEKSVMRTVNLQMIYDRFEYIRNSIYTLSKFEFDEEFLSRIIKRIRVRGVLYCTSTIFHSPISLKEKKDFMKTTREQIKVDFSALKECKSIKHKIIVMLYYLKADRVLNCIFK